MSSPEPNPATTAVTVAQALAFSDEELARFIEDHYDALDGGLPVYDFAAVSKDEGEHLAERLRTAFQTLADNPIVHSCPLDLDQVNARLLALTSNHDGGGGASEAEESYDEEDWLKAIDTDGYHDLVKAGGRPVYPIGLMDDVFSDPEKYSEELQILQDPHNSRSLLIFQRQWQRWQGFRRWQVDNHGLEDDEGGFPAHLEMRKRNAKRDMTRKGHAAWLAEIEADDSVLHNTWRNLQEERERQRHDNREHGCTGFPDYAEAVRRRLARHGFAVPFQLKEDPKEPDRLTTWIEYLNQEYWRLDKYAESLERLTPVHDKAWQELVDAGVLMPHETRESVRTMASGMQDQAAIELAREALEAAEVSATIIRDPRHLDIPKGERKERRRGAEAEVDAAKTRLERAQRRGDLIGAFARGTVGYKRAREDMARQSLLVPWALEQVPLIEAELAQEAETVDTGPEAVAGNGKRRRAAAGEEGEEGEEGQGEDRRPKRQKRARADRPPDDLQSTPPKPSRRRPRGGRRRAGRPGPGPNNRRAAAAGKLGT